MAQALGYVTKNGIGNFAGTLTLGGTSRINIVANDNKESAKSTPISDRLTAKTRMTLRSSGIRKRTKS